LFQENFEDASLSSRGWYDNANVVLSSTEHIPGSTRSAQFTFNQGATLPTTGLGARHKFTPTSSLYVSFYVKYSSNWVGSGKTYHPHEIYVLSNMDGDYDGPANNWMTLYIEHNYQQNGGVPVIAVQDNKTVNSSLGTPPLNLVGVTENRSTGACNSTVEGGFNGICYRDGALWYSAKQLAGPVALQPKPGAGYKSDWNFVEVYFQMNSVANGVGQADGALQYWFNGSLIIDRHDVRWRTGARPNIQWAQLMLSPYIGDGSPITQSIYYDNLRVATGRLP